VIGAAACVDEFADLRREILADPGNAEPIGGGQRGDRVAQVRQSIRGVSIRADLERVLVLDFEEVADLGKHARNGEVFHVEAHYRGGRQQSHFHHRVSGVSRAKIMFPLTLPALW